MIKYKEALSKMKKAIPNRTLKEEKIKSVKSLGRVLAENIIAKKALPDHDFAAMDGYAVKTKDIQNASKNNPIELNSIGELYPPDHPDRKSVV